MPLNLFENSVTAQLQDGAGRLPLATIDTFIVKAITQRYSQDRPALIVTDIPGAGLSDIAIPTDATFVFEQGFSVIRQVEFPVGNVPENVIDRSDWYIYPTPAGLKIRLLTIIPTVTDNVRVTWTARHKNDGSTVPGNDIEAVSDFASSLCFEALAALYAQVKDNTIKADTVNYRTKSQEYLAMAKAARQRYYNFMGVEDGPGAAEQGPALATGEMHETLAVGLDRMTHNKYTR